MGFLALTCFLAHKKVKNEKFNQIAAKMFRQHGISMVGKSKHRGPLTGCLHLKLWNPFTHFLPGSAKQPIRLFATNMVQTPNVTEERLHQNGPNPKKYLKPKTDLRDGVIQPLRINAALFESQRPARVLRQKRSAAPCWRMTQSRSGSSRLSQGNDLLGPVESLAGLLQRPPCKK